jgi:hypothetical protein
MSKCSEVQVSNLKLSNFFTVKNVVNYFYVI